MKQKGRSLAEHGRKMSKGHYELDPGEQRGAGRCTGQSNVIFRGAASFLACTNTAVSWNGSLGRSELNPAS